MILLGLTIAGLLIAFDMPLRALLSPATRAARAAGTTLQDRTVRAGDTVTAAKGADARNASEAAAAAGVGVMAEPGRKGRATKVPAVDAPGQTGVWGTDNGGDGVPYGVQNPPPTSATIAPLRTPGGGAAPAMAVAATGASATRTT